MSEPSGRTAMIAGVRKANVPAIALRLGRVVQRKLCRACFDIIRERDPRQPVGATIDDMCRHNIPRPQLQPRREQQSLVSVVI